MTLFVIIRLKMLKYLWKCPLVTTARQQRQKMFKETKVSRTTDVQNVCFWLRLLVLGRRRTTHQIRATPAAPPPPTTLPPRPTVKWASWPSCRPPRRRSRTPRSSPTSEPSPPPSTSTPTTKSSASSPSLQTDRTGTRLQTASLSEITQ